MPLADEGIQLSAKELGGRTGTVLGKSLEGEGMTPSMRNARYTYSESQLLISPNLLNWILVLNLCVDNNLNGMYGCMAFVKASVDSGRTWKPGQGFPMGADSNATCDSECRNVVIFPNHNGDNPVIDNIIISGDFGLSWHSVSTNASRYPTDRRRFDIAQYRYLGDTRLAIYGTSGYRRVSQDLGKTFGDFEVIDIAYEFAEDFRLRPKPIGLSATKLVVKWKAVDATAISQRLQIKGIVTRDGSPMTAEFLLHPEAVDPTTVSEWTRVVSSSDETKFIVFWKAGGSEFISRVALTPLPTEIPKTVATSTPLPTKIPKTVATKKTIKCVKGKIAKRITATNPKCPAGYRRA